MATEGVLDYPIFSPHSSPPSFYPKEEVMFPELDQEIPVNGSPLALDSQDPGALALDHSQAELAVIDSVVLKDVLLMNSKLFTEEDDRYILSVLVQAYDSGASYRDALNSLHMVNGKNASLWKDRYLEEKFSYDQVIFDYIHPSASQSPTPDPSPSSSSKPALTIKKPVIPSSASQPPTRASSSSSTSRRVGRRKKPKISVQPAPQLPVSKGRKTMNSITAPEAVFNSRLPAPNSEIVVPPAPTRCPTPPTKIVPSGRGYRFTPEDHDFFVTYIHYRLSQDASLTRKELLDELHQQQPHHSRSSWEAYWSNHHDLPDKILLQYHSTLWESKSAHDEDSDPSGSSSDDSRNSPLVFRLPIRRTGPPANPRPSTSDPLVVNAASNHPSGSENDMSVEGDPLSVADRNILAMHISAFENWRGMSNPERWDDFSAKYPARSLSSWIQHYEQCEADLLSLAAKFSRRREAKFGSKRKEREGANDVSSSSMAKRIRSTT